MRIKGFHTIDDSIATPLNILVFDHLKTRKLDRDFDFENEIKAIEPIANLYLHDDKAYHYSESILLYFLKLRPFHSTPSVKNIDEEGFKNFLLSLDNTSRLWKYFQVENVTSKYNWEDFVNAMCRLVFSSNMSTENSDTHYYTYLMMGYISIVAKHHYWVKGFEYLLDLHRHSIYLIELQNDVLSFSL